MSNAFKGQAASQGQYEIPEAGSSPAVIVGLVDLGTQTRTYQGQTSESHKVLILFQLDQTKSDGTPFILSKDETLSFHRKSNLRKLAETIRGKTYDDGQPIDYSALVGQTVLLTIETATSSSGSEYCKVANITKIPKGMAKVQPQVDTICWSIGDYMGVLPSWIPYLYGQKITDVISSSRELSGGVAPARATSDPAPRNGRKADEVPF
jgi:hypothetical protein